MWANKRQHSAERCKKDIWKKEICKRFQLSPQFELQRVCRYIFILQQENIHTFLGCWLFRNIMCLCFHQNDHRIFNIVQSCTVRDCKVIVYLTTLGWILSAFCITLLNFLSCILFGFLWAFVKLFVAFFTLFGWRLFWLSFYQGTARQNYLRNKRKSGRWTARETKPTSWKSRQKYLRHQTL